jgi:hypothetical protein
LEGQEFCSGATDLINLRFFTASFQRTFFRGSVPTNYFDTGFSRRHYDGRSVVLAFLAAPSHGFSGPKLETKSP